jgi:L-threonine kinase
MAEARCPASCGELLQGLIQSSEKLISCPINWFSTVEVKTGKPDLQHERPMMRQALLSVLRWLEIPEKASRELAIRYDSTIPIAKGMASSTADIAATIMATARHFGVPLPEHSIAKLCVSLEPTDSTIFNQLTLFDHNKGSIHRQFDWVPELDVLILESPSQLTTSDYHLINRRAQLVQNETILTDAWHIFQDGMEQKDITQIGRAATLSATASQNILPKPHFQELLKIVARFSLPGLNIAHSGTVVGLLIDNALHDHEEIIRALKESEPGRYYTRFHQMKLISGGIE